MPAGTLKGVHFVKTPDYVQITGMGDFTKINVKARDEGGELDPHGANVSKKWCIGSMCLIFLYREMETQSEGLSTEPLSLLLANRSSFMNGTTNLSFGSRTSLTYYSGQTLCRLQSFVSAHALALMPPSTATISTMLWGYVFWPLDRNEPN